MEPEEIDNLFNERLGRMAPTPPADLWNRLQDRMEAEMPQKQEEKRRFGWLYYSIAAAITLLLAVSIVLRFQQPQTTGEATIAQVKPATEVAEPAEISAPAEAASITEQSIAAITPEETITAPAKTEQQTIIAKTEKAGAKKPATIKRNKEDQQWVKVETTQPAAMLAQQTTKPVAPETANQATSLQTPVAFASANSAQPVEIIIKRAVGPEPVAMAAAPTQEKSSSFEKKQRLAKNIFKQVKNLSNGEEINFSEIGINANKIALETQIGKQKISKVINL